MKTNYEAFLDYIGKTERVSLKDLETESFLKFSFPTIKVECPWEPARGNIEGQITPS